MGHFVNSDVTAGPTPSIHAGLNVKVASYTLSETASGSLTIAMCNIPGGAQVVDAQLQWDNNALALGAAPGTIAVLGKTGGTTMATFVQSASANSTPQLYNPADGSIGYRFTSSSQAVLSLHNLPASGTAATVFTLVLSYISSEDPDG